MLFPRMTTTGTTLTGKNIFIHGDSFSGAIIGSRIASSPPGHYDLPREILLSLCVPHLYVIQSLATIPFGSQCPEFDSSIFDAEPFHLCGPPPAIAARNVLGCDTIAYYVDRSVCCRQHSTPRIAFMLHRQPRRRRVGRRTRL